MVRSRTSKCTNGYCSSSNHRGIDFANGCGAYIYAAASGTVDAAFYNGGYGNYIRIQHGGGIATGYAHIRPADTSSATASRSLPASASPTPATPATPSAATSTSRCTSTAPRSTPRPSCAGAASRSDRAAVAASDQTID
nr:peptidoglycan DD-metalloendopeptidase family protein [Microbacterium sp. NIBRBAC000506063]